MPFFILNPENILPISKLFQSKVSDYSNRGGTTIIEIKNLNEKKNGSKFRFSILRVFYSQRTLSAVVMASRSRFSNR